MVFCGGKNPIVKILLNKCTFSFIAGPVEIHKQTAFRIIFKNLSCKQYAAKTELILTF